MFGKRIKVFRLAGFAVHVDLSWLMLGFLVTWTLAVGYFPAALPTLPLAAYWWMGVAGAVGLFISIVAHELAHSVVARRYGIEIKGITLFIFGGVAEMASEPPSPRSEFMVAIAGPIASAVAGVLCVGLDRLALFVNHGLPLAAVLGYLGWMNFLLAAFNLVPAFPLDGGRVLQSILWGTKKNLHWATRVSSAIGGGFGTVLVILGVLSFIRGNVITGIWWFILGLFIRAASKMEFRQMILRELLRGERVRNFMRADTTTVPSSATVRELVDDYIYKRHHKLYPVMNDGQLTGCITLNRVKEVPTQEWDRRTVGELASRCSDSNSITPDADAAEAISTMQRTHASRLLVVENGRLAGILTLKDLLDFITLKMELEGGAPPPLPLHGH